MSSDATYISCFFFSFFLPKESEVYMTNYRWISYSFVAICFMRTSLPIRHWWKLLRSCDDIAWTTAQFSFRWLVIKQPASRTGAGIHHSLSQLLNMILSHTVLFRSNYHVVNFQVWSSELWRSKLQNWLARVHHPWERRWSYWSCMDIMNYDFVSFSLL